MKNIARIIFGAVLISSISAQARCGSGGSCGGGGDARVVFFLNALSSVCEWMHGDSVYQAYFSVCRAQLEDLEDSIHNPNRRARIYSQYDDIVLDNAAPKTARVILDEDNPDNLMLSNIEIAMNRWDNSSVTDKLVTAAIEMSILVNLHYRRYAVGALFFQSEVFKRAHQRLAYIDKKDPMICVVDAIGKTMQGWIDFRAAYDAYTYRRVYDGAELKILRNVLMKIPNADGQVIEETGVEVRVITNRRNAAMLESRSDAKPNETIRFPSDIEFLCKK